MKESEGDRLKCVVYESTRAPQKRKPTPPRCARQPLPREGARVDTPSFLWKEVPRRGGGWMGEAVSPTQSLPQWGRLRNENTAFLAPSKRIHAYVEKQYRRTKLSLHGEGKEEAASPQKKEANPASLHSAAPSKGRGSRGHSLLPMEGGAPKGRRLDGESGIPDTKPSPRGEGGERSEPDRVLAV